MLDLLIGYLITALSIANLFYFHNSFIHNLTILWSYSSLIIMFIVILGVIFTKEDIPVAEPKDHLQSILLFLMGLATFGAGNYWVGGVFLVSYFLWLIIFTKPNS